MAAIYINAEIINNLAQPGNVWFTGADNQYYSVDDVEFKITDDSDVDDAFVEGPPPDKGCVGDTADWYYDPHPSVGIDGLIVVRGNENVQISEHFKVGEFQCNDGSPMMRLSPGLIDVLEILMRVLKDEGAETMYITSGYRTWPHNAKQSGAADHSYHMDGIAADVQVKNNEGEYVDIGTVYDIACKLIKNNGGVGKYYTLPREKRFVHIDIRGYKARWKQ